MATDWEEIKRLAADFQKAQQKTNLLRLSDQNIIEIVSLLVKRNLVQVVYTNDGKEYITPEHLETEVYGELAASGGRANLVEVSKSLNVDLSRVEHAASRLVESGRCKHLVLGQLINEVYVANLAQDINERLTQRGELSVAELATIYDLPTDFVLQKIVEPNLGRRIQGRQDPQNPRVIFTQGYIERCKAKMRGALVAVTRPINVAAIVQQIGVPERIFYTLFDELSPAGQLTSKLANAEYVPHIYAKTQADWVLAFYKQNGYLEYEAINRLGISDAKQYIRKQLPEQQLIFLTRIALGTRILDLNVLSVLQECLASGEHVDLASILPSNFTDEDIEEVYNAFAVEQPELASQLTFIAGIALSRPYLTALLQPCHELAFEQAKAALDNGVYQQYLIEKQLASKSQRGGGAADEPLYEDSKNDRRGERRRKAASGKSGGGAQGRETKTKSVKKQRGGRVAATSLSDDEESSSHRQSKAPKSLELLKPADVAQLISKQLNDDGLEHLVDIIVEKHWRKFNQLAVMTAEQKYVATPQTNRRELHAITQDRINSLLDDIRLYEKGLKLFPLDVQTQLSKYLLKSIGNDICNELLSYVASESNITLKSDALNVDQRLKFIQQECSSEYKSFMLELNRALNKTLPEFAEAVELALKACSMIVKKLDKHKDHATLLQHKAKLQEQLQQATDHALVLHLVALLLFTSITDCILHASGKFVANIISFLAKQLDDKAHALLTQYHSLVLKLLQSGSDGDAAINEQLEALQLELKQLALTFAKPGVTKAE